jgi:hypothetical protein
VDSLPALQIEDRHIFDPAFIDIKINHLGSLKAPEIAGLQALAVRGGHCPALSRGLSKCLVVGFRLGFIGKLVDCV